MTREEFVRKNSWVLAVIRDRCELTRAEKDYLNILIEVLAQEPKTGHWCRGEKDKHGYYHFHCSECNEEIQTKNKDFCDPYCCMCGAKMESEG